MPSLLLAAARLPCRVHGPGVAGSGIIASVHSHHRGSALITVLLVSALLIVVCFSLASTAMLNLNLADAYQTQTQAMLIAQAAVHQISSELDDAAATATSGATSGDGDERLDLLARFSGKPVFPTGADRFPGTASVTFDTRDDHYSVDNSTNEGSAQGWLDRGTAQRSVPPFCIDLIIRVKIAGRTHHFQALLRRRWPYALTTPGKITLMGAPTYASDRATVTQVPSKVSGRVYHLPRLSFTMPPPPNLPAPFDDGSDVYVEAELIHNQLNVFPREIAAVTVGGAAELRPQPTLSDPSPAPVLIESSGNVLEGNVDVTTLSTENAVEAAGGNLWSGTARGEVRPRNLLANLQRAFVIPREVATYTSLLPPGPPVSAPHVPEPPPDDGSGTGFPTDGSSPPGGDNTPVDGNEEGSPPPPAPTPIPSPSASPNPSASPEPEPTPSPFYAIQDGDLRLDGPSPPEGETFVYPDTSCFRIDMSCGNRWVDGRKVLFSSGYGLEMHNCILYIAGNLDLSSRESAQGATLRAPALRGTNATLIVDGTLILNNGSLEAAGAGMVIYCRRLVTAAQGEYRGLIMVQKAAAICPAFPKARLRIEGGIVCGGESIRLYTSGPNDEEDLLTTWIQGLHLWSTEVVYKPQFLKTLNRFGPLELINLRQIE